MQLQDYIKYYIGCRVQAYPYGGQQKRTECGRLVGIGIYDVACSALPPSAPLRSFWSDQRRAGGGWENDLNGQGKAGALIQRDIEEFENKKT